MLILARLQTKYWQQLNTGKQRLDTDHWIPQDDELFIFDNVNKSEIEQPEVKFMQVTILQQQKHVVSELPSDWTYTCPLKDVIALWLVCD